tara:strand:- start:470 stop:1096 length:627 start_codon:yes stop_codon:yes gene_type:complete
MWALVESSSVSQELLNPVDITIDGTKHSSQIFSAWTASELKDIGIYSMTLESIDERFYTVNWDSPTYTVDDDAGTVVKHPGTKTAASLASVKNTLSMEVNERAYAILVQSDWQVVRAYETQLNANTSNTTVSQSLLNYRQSIRSTADSKLLEITNMTAVANAENYNTGSGWPSSNVASTATVSTAKILDEEKDRINTILTKRVAIFSE